jgi:hypothetical protein
VRSLIDQSRQMGASDDQIRDLMVKAPFLQDTWQASEKAGIPPADVFAHFGLAAPTPPPQRAAPDTTVGEKIGDAIGDAATRVGSAIGAGYKSGVLTPEAQAAVEGVPVVGPALGLLSRDVGAAYGGMGGLFGEAQRGVAAATDAIVPPNRGGSLGRELAASMEVAPALGHVPVGAAAEAVRGAATDALARIGKAGDVDTAIQAAGDAVNGPVAPSGVPVEEPDFSITNPIGPVRPTPDEAIPPPAANDEAGLQSVGAASSREMAAPGAIPEVTPAQTATALQKMVTQSAEDRLTPQGRDDAVYVDGVERPEAMRDFALAAPGEPSTALEHKTLYNTDSNYHDQFDAQVKKNNNVMVDKLNDQFGDANTRDAAMNEAKELMPGPVGLFDDQQPVSASPIAAEIQDILASPAGKRGAVRTVLNGILSNLYDADGSLEELPSMLKGVRDDITDKLYDKTPTVEGNAARTARNQLNAVLDVVDETIASGLPGTKYQDYLSNLSAALGRVDKLDYMQKFLTGSRKLTDIAGNLQLNKVQKMLEDIQAHHADLTGGAKEMTPEDINQIEAVRNELAAKDLLDRRAGVRGSPTTQLTNAAGVMGSGPLGTAVRGAGEMALHAAGPFTHGATNLAAGAYRLVVKPMMAASEAREAAAKLEATKARLLDTTPRNPDIEPPPEEPGAAPPPTPTSGGGGVGSPLPTAQMGLEPAPKAAPALSQVQREQAALAAMKSQAEQRRAIPGAIFASPNIAEHLNFPEAVAGLQTRRQATFGAMSDDIDTGMGLKTRSRPAIGAWADGAENSVMTEVSGGSWDELRASAAMKGAIGDQKATLVFQEAPDGTAVLSSFPAKGDLATIHQNLLDDGVAFHTIVPTQGGAMVYVADMDGSAVDAVKRAADRYGEQPAVQGGRAEFIGTEKQDGTDAEQRADARAVYSRVIQESGVPGIASLGERLRDTYGQAAPVDPGAPVEPGAAGYGSQNRFFTKEDADDARATLKAKAGQLNSGLDPEALAAMVRLAGFHIESGARSFGQFSTRMIHDMGEAVRPHLEEAYAAAKTMLGDQPGPRRARLTISQEPLGADRLERNLSVNDILDPAFPSLAARSRGVEDIAQQLMTRGGNALKALGVKEGKITEPAPLTDELLSRTIGSEIKAALDRGGKTASDWYTHKIIEAKAAASTMHPEIATDPNANMAYTASLAITSQGETVPSNVRLGDQAYLYFKENGRFPTNVVAKNGPAMNANFTKLNRLIDTQGVDGAREFLSNDFTVKDLKTMGYDIGGENVGTQVKGSAILGPKIGGGFYQNLNGNFNPVTMDLWFMRAWGRLTGTLVGMAPEALAKQRTRLEAALEAVGQKVPKTDQALMKAAEDVIKTHERDYVTNRAAYDSGEKAKSELTYAAERFQKGQNGINEQPGSGSARTWMRSVVMRARDLLAGEGINVTPADLQAIWWYPEKDLYGKLGGRDSEGINVDYASAISDLARKKGVSDDTLARAMGTVDQRP